MKKRGLNKALNTKKSGNETGRISMKVKRLLLQAICSERKKAGDKGEASYKWNEKQGSKRSPKGVAS